MTRRQADPAPSSRDLEPLDPDSPKGRAAADHLNTVLAGARLRQEREAAARAERLSA